MSRVTMELLCCSFCGKTEYQAEYMVAGPGDVSICGECIELCMNILLESRIKQRTPTETKEG